MREQVKAKSYREYTHILKRLLPTNQAAPRHGDTTPKHRCVPVKHDSSIHVDVHTRPQQGYPTPTVVDKRVVTVERDEYSVGGDRGGICTVP